MKRFFIVDLNEDGSPLGFATDNLYKDFILKYKITWSEGEDTDLFGRDITILVNKKNTNKISYYKFYQNFKSPEYNVLNEILEKYEIPINYLEKLKINQ